MISAGFLWLLSVVPLAAGFRTAVIAQSQHARCVSPVCCDVSDVLPAGATDAIPPEKLADAWNREEKASQLSDVLKGCSLYLVGLGPKKTAVGRVLARRLVRYRYYDIGSLLTSTYQQVAKVEEPVTMPELMAAEPLEDVEQLSSAVLQQVQAFSRSVFVTWDGAVGASDYAVMQQGIVVHIAQDAAAETALLPKEGADEALEKWQAGFEMADVTVEVGEGDAADDAAYKVVDAVLSFVKKNPAKSVEWKAQADAKMAAQGGD
mmetsp:Transcript_9967/g.25781  ORF Transcript_9967/g.25781 Transcript_9967/m.25781 type:complete len:263 (+) Transcript_9967:3-791(+)